MKRVGYKEVGVLTDATGFPYNPRGYPGEVTELEAEMERDGQRTPLSVTEPNERGIYIITRGHRRKQAIDNLRAKARKMVRQTNEAVSRFGPDVPDDDPELKKAEEKLAFWLGEVERWSYYDINVNGINPADLRAVLRDMDAGIYNKPVDPIAYGETIMYRMDKLEWTFQQCYESLSLSEQKARACLRAADPKQTSESVRSALRTGDMSLSMFIKRISKLDIQTQERVMKAAQQKAEGKNAAGVISGHILNGVLDDISGDAAMPATPDSDVLPLLARSRDDLYAALRLRKQWGEATRESAAWILEEMLLVIQGEFNEQEREA